MKKFIAIKSILILAISCLVMVACTDGSEELQDELTLEGKPMHFTAMLAAKQPTTRALSNEQEATEGKIVSEWKVGEEIALVYKVKEFTIVNTAKVVEVTDDGMARVDADLTFGPSSNTDLKLIYPASAADENGEVKENLILETYGHLETISQTQDVATADTKLIVTKNGFATLEAPATLQHCFALVKFTLVDDDDEPIYAVDLYASDEHDDKISLAFPTNYGYVRNVFYIPLRPMNDAEVHFTVTDRNLDTYTATQYGTLQAGCFYQKTLKMHKRVPVTELPDIGSLYYSDGTWGDQRHKSNAVPIGVVAYYNPDEEVILDRDGSRSYHGIVIALKDAEHETSAQFQTQALIDEGNAYDDRYDFKWGTSNKISGLMEACMQVTKGRAHLAAYNMAGWRNTDILYDHYEEGLTDQTYGNSADYQGANAAETFVPDNLPRSAAKGRQGDWYMGSVGEWMLVLNALGKKNVFSPPTALFNWTMSGTDYVEQVNKVLTDAGATGLGTELRQDDDRVYYLTSSLDQENEVRDYCYVLCNSDYKANALGYTYGFIFEYRAKGAYPSVANEGKSVNKNGGSRVRPFLAF